MDVRGLQNGCWVVSIRPVALYYHSLESGSYFDDLEFNFLSTPIKWLEFEGPL